MSPIAVLPGLTPASYRPHPLHGEGCDWPEKNARADLWIGFVHTLGLEPLAMLASTVAVNFEGDQWTPFKPLPQELRALYGIDVCELALWRPLIEHAREHLAAHKLISADVDAHGLPDTAGADDRRSHFRTSILMAELDESRERLGYFRGTGYHELQGEDFRALFRLGAPPDPACMPPFAELVRIDRLARRGPTELADQAFELLRGHFAWRPRSNPFSRFAARIAQDWPAMCEEGLAHYNEWAFASVRQAGAAFELLAAHLRWLATQGYPELSEPAQRFDAIGSANKTLLHVGARAISAGKPLSADEWLQGMASDWERGMAMLGPLVMES